MKVRYKSNKAIDISDHFNTHAVGEVITGEGGSTYLHELDVWLEQKKEWKDMSQAFVDHDLIVDSFNTKFFEPRDEEERKRGYSV